MNKLEPKEHFHGSDLEKIEEIYGIPKENIISFSANVNPLGISYDLRKELPKHLDAITRYPDREYTSLRKCIGEYVHTDYENILVGNGSTELISLVAQIMQPKNALIVGPTYSEYEQLPFSPRYQGTQQNIDQRRRSARVVQSQQPNLFSD